MHDGVMQIVEGGGKKEVKCVLRQWLAIHAVSERPESRRAKAQGL